MTALAEAQWGRTRIAYTLGRRARQETLSIPVGPDGSVEVEVPGLGVDLEQGCRPDQTAKLCLDAAKAFFRRFRGHGFHGLR